MAARYKRQCSKLGRATRQTSRRRNAHSIIVPGATAKRGSANTPKKWKLRRPPDTRFSRAADAIRVPTFVGTDLLLFVALYGIGFWPATRWDSAGVGSMLAG